MADGEIIKNYDFDTVNSGQLGSWIMNKRNGKNLVVDKTAFTINAGVVSRNFNREVRLVQTFDAVLTNDQEYTVLISEQANDNIPSAEILLMNSSGVQTKVTWTQIDGVSVVNGETNRPTKIRKTGTFKVTNTKTKGIAVILRSKSTKLSSVNLATGAPVDCVGEWSEWGECDAECGGGTKTRTYSVTTSAIAGGTECDYSQNETQTDDCNTDDCPEVEGCTDYTNAPATLLVSGITDYGGFYDSGNSPTGMNGTYTLRNVAENGRPAWRKNANSDSFQIYYETNEWYFEYTAYTYKRKFKLNDNSQCPWEGSWTYQGDVYYSNQSSVPNPDNGSNLSSARVTNPSSSSASGNSGSAGESDCPSSSELSTIYVSNDDSIDLGNTAGQANGTYNRESAQRANKAYWLRSGSPYYGIRWYDNAHGGAWVIGNVGQAAGKAFNNNGVKYSPYSYTNEDCFVNATWTHVAGTGGGTASTTLDVSNTQASSGTTGGPQGINPDNWPDEIYVVNHPQGQHLGGSYLKSDQTTGGGSNGDPSFPVYSNGYYELKCLATEISGPLPTDFKWGFNPGGINDVPFYYGTADETSNSGDSPLDVTFTYLVSFNGRSVSAAANGFNMYDADSEADIDAIKSNSTPTFTKTNVTASEQDISVEMSVTSVDRWKVYITYETYTQNSHSRNVQYETFGEGSVEDESLSFHINPELWMPDTTQEFTIYYEGFLSGNESPVVEAYSEGTTTISDSYTSGTDVIPYKAFEDCASKLDISLTANDTHLLYNQFKPNDGDNTLEWKGFQMLPYKGSNSHYPPRRIYRNGKKGAHRACLWYDVAMHSWMITQNPYKTDNWVIQQSVPFTTVPTDGEYQSAMTNLGSTAFNSVLEDKNASEPFDVVGWNYTSSLDVADSIGLTVQESQTQAPLPLPDSNCKELIINKHFDFGQQQTTGKRVVKFWTKLTESAQVPEMEYLVKDTHTEATENYLEIKQSATYSNKTYLNIFTPLIEESVLSPAVNNQEPVGGYYGASTTYSTKFAKSNRLLKPNTEYVLRLGTYKDAGTKTRVEFTKFYNNKFTGTQVTLLEIDGDAVPSTGSFKSFANIRSSLVFKTSLKPYQLPVILNLRIRHGFPISSVSLSPKTCVNASDDSSTFSKTTSTNSPVNWTNAGKQIAGNALYSGQLTKGNIVKQKSLNHILFRNKFSTDMIKAKNYELTLFNPTGEKYSVNFSTNNYVDDVLIKWTEVDGLAVSNPKFSKAGIAVEKTAKFRTINKDIHVPNEITIDIGGEILENSNFQKKDGFVPDNWCVLDEHLAPREIDVDMFNQDFIKNKGVLRTLFPKSFNWPLQAGENRGIPLTQKFKDGFSLASHQSYRIEIEKFGTGHLGKQISVLFLDENMKPIEMKWTRRGQDGSDYIHPCGRFGDYESTDDATIKGVKTSAVFEYADLKIVTPDYFVIFSPFGVSLKSVSLRAVSTDATVNSKTGLLGGYEIKQIN